MKFLIVCFAVISTVYSLEKRCMFPCTTIIKPVCASDGHSYTNECAIRVKSCVEKEAIVAVRSGACPKGDVQRCVIRCPIHPTQVCGSDGKLYRNECEIRHASCIHGKAITIVRPVEKEGDDCSKCDMRCPMIFQPVCAHNGHTYPSECAMKVEACMKKTPIVKLYDRRCME